MVDRNKDYVRRRTSVLGRDQADEGKPENQEADVKSRHRSFRQLIPLFIIAGFAFLIAKEEVPAVNDWWQRMTAPDEWMARHTCQQAAMENISNPDFARVLKPGEVHETQDGLYVDNLVLGEMGESGGETSVRFTCYLDKNNKPVKVNRLTGDE